MNKQLQKKINEVDNCGDSLYPDSVEISKNDQKIIDDIVEILCQDRFCHDGWVDYDHYKSDAAYFILECVRQYEKNS